MVKNPLDQIRSTLVIMILLGVFYILPLSIYPLFTLFGIDDIDTAALFTLQNLIWAMSYLLIGWLLWQVTGRYRDELATIVLNIPAAAEIRSYIRLSIAMVIAAIGFIYLLYYPLSLVFPTFVQERLLDMPYLLYWDEEGYYWLSNLAAIVLAVVFAPVLEEFLFRGYLLNRWTLRFGPLPAMLLSAFIFAILHPDVLGAFVFAVILSLLYMKTRSLLAPIIVHAANNMLAVIIEWLDRSLFTGFTPVTISDFQDDLWLGIVCMLIGFPWLGLYVRRHLLPLQPLLLAHQQGKHPGNNHLA